MQQNRGFEINHQIFSKTSQLVIVAEDEGFEPSVGFPTHAFQACALGRYANPPFESKPILRVKISQFNSYISG